MSLVYLTYHGENVQDLDKISGEEKPQKFKYTSKFRETIQKETQQPRLTVTADGKKLLASSGKYEHRTMGHSQIPLNAPSQFMRKNHGVKWRRVHDHVCPKDKNLPPIPLRPLTSIKPLTTSNQCEENCNCQCNDKHTNKRANFIALNIDRVKQSQPKRPHPRYVDTPHGDRHNLLDTGLIPQYVHGKNFGKVPCYLRMHKNVAKQMHEIFMKDQRRLSQAGDYMQRFGTRQLTNEERASLLDGLKTNFMEQSKVFQRLSLFTDTLAKKLRKARIENVLRQLEQDIYLLERNPVIYVSNY